MRNNHRAIIHGGVGSHEEFPWLVVLWMMRMSSLCEERFDKGESNVEEPGVGQRVYNEFRGWREGKDG